MKKYDNIDYSLFLKIICIVSVLALVFAIAVVTIGIFFSADSKESETYESHIKLPEDTEEKDETNEPADSTESLPPETEETTPPETEEDIPVSPSPTVLGESEDMGQEYLNKIVFLVDATNVGLRSYGVLDGGKNTKQVWRTGSGTLTLSDICSKKIIYPESGTEMTVAQAAAKAKPEYLVIALGFEGINNISAEDFSAQYTALIDAVKEASPDTKIMLQSIYPIASRVTGKLSNSIIDEANNSVMSVAQSNDVKYLDTCVILKDGSGAMKEEYDNGGTGWNLNQQGFEAVLAYIRTHGYK